MALMDDILAWAAGLSGWQSDALRRLMRDGLLSADGGRSDFLALGVSLMV